MGLKRCPSFSKRPGFPCGLRVLLVEADSSGRSSTELLLKDCNYSVTTCSTTSEALTCLTSSSYDVLLADKSMVSGKTRDRQQLLDSSKGLPCILMAEDPSPADIMAGIQLGAVDFLAKPLSPLKLQNIWQHTVRKMMGNMNINCTTEQQAAAAAGAAATAEPASAAAATAAVKKELDEMEVILEEPECEEAAQQPDGQAVTDKITSIVSNCRPVVNTAANVALATASSFYESTKSLSRSGSSAMSESCCGGSSPSSPYKAGLAGNKRTSSSKHPPVHSCPSTRSLNSMASCYSSLQLAVPQSPTSPSADTATEAAEEAGNGPQSSSVAAAAAPSSSPSPCPLQQQRSIKKAVRHPTPATPASKPPLNPSSTAAAKAQAAQQQGSGAMGPGCGATAAGPLPTGTMGLTSVPLPTGLGPLPQGMVWGMPMCPLARAPGIVPPKTSTNSSTAGSSQQQQVGNNSAAAAGMMMPWGMCGMGPMGMPMGMPGLPPPPFMPGFMMPGMPPMPMPMPFGPYGAAAGMMAPTAGFGYDPAAQQQQMQQQQQMSVPDAAAAAAAPVAALPAAPQMQQAGSTGASMAAALNASLSGLGSGATAAAADAMDIGDAFDFMLGDITAEDDLDVGMSGLLDGELAGLEKNGLNLPSELQELQALEVQQQQAAAAAACQQQCQSFDCSAYSSQRMSYDCHASSRQRVSFDCSTASTTTGNRVSFDCSVNTTAGGRGGLARSGSQRVSFEVSCCNTNKAAAAAAQGGMAAPAAAACPSGFEQQKQQSSKGSSAAAAAVNCSDPLLGSMSDLFAACSGDSCSDGSAGMTHVDSCGMLADLQSLFASDGCAGMRDDGCSTAAAAAAAGLFDDVMDDLPLEMAMKKSSSLADLLAGGLTPMQA